MAFAPKRRCLVALAASSQTREPGDERVVRLSDARSKAHGAVGGEALGDTDVARLLAIVDTVHVAEVWARAARG